MVSDADVGLTKTALGTCHWRSQDRPTGALPRACGPLWLSEKFENRRVLRGKLNKLCTIDQPPPEEDHLYNSNSSCNYC